ncbi:MAG: hypothetical protein U1F43_34380 [Myxococcota bacterium]
MRPWVSRWMKRKTSQAAPRMLTKDTRRAARKSTPVTSDTAAVAAM